MHYCLSLRPHVKIRNKINKFKKSIAGGKLKIISVDIPSNTTPLIQGKEPVSKDANAKLFFKNGSCDQYPEGTFCVAVKDNRILASGSYDDCAAFIDGDTTSIDLEGRTLAAGLCDSHFHLLVGAERLHGIDIEDVRTPSELRFRIQDFVKNRPDAKAVHVYGLHYLDPPLIPAEKAREFLDSILDNRPLFIYAHDLHTGWANTKAMEAADIFKPMPPFPEIIEHLKMEQNIELDSEKMPTGEFREPETYFLVEGPMRSMYPVTLDHKLQYLKEIFSKLAATGLTSIHNMGLGLPEEDIELLILLLELEQNGQLPLRVTSYYSIIPDEHMQSDILFAAQIRDKLQEARQNKISYAELHSFLIEKMKQCSEMRHQACINLEENHPHVKGHPKLPSLGHYSHHLRRHIHTTHVEEHVRRLEKRMKEIDKDVLDSSGMVAISGVKIFMDGVMEKDTAYRLDQKPIEGIPAYDPETLKMVVTKSDQAGLQVSAHCIGNGSVQAFLDAVEYVRNQNQDLDQKRGHPIRHRMEHIEICRPEDIERFSKLNVTPSMQPLHERPPVTLWHQKVDRKLWPTAFPWRSLKDNGSALVFGSDWPIVSCNCLDAMKRAVTRPIWAEGMPDQSLTKAEVLESFSASPAFLEYKEKTKGQLKPGMVADLVIFSDDLDKISDDIVDYVKVVCTVCNGTLTFSDSERFSQVGKIES